MSVKVNRKGKKKKYFQLTWTDIELEEGSVYSTASITEETAFFAATLYLRIHNDLLKNQNLNIISNGSYFTLKQTESKLKITYKIDPKKNCVQEADRYYFKCSTSTRPISDKDYNQAKLRIAKKDKIKKSKLEIPPTKVYLGGSVSPK
ncbi:hypothetical protein [Neobacillus sp. OS1-33]|uniref:hypothetical protein n=1 Tax=Neobacillus sp. OS1-33 TaxID=3070683 RepID=UPI0027E01913|nr:hypothetical protein [Neobacillus sp. OS1-33]WML26264.1 hypothetical protein RCG22_01045 [Neobacillus sp. OS1-33]